LVAPFLERALAWKDTDKGTMRVFPNVRLPRPEPPPLQ
jgi:hypothetical protein